MNQRIAGILMRSRAMTDALLACTATRGLRAEIGATFGFDEVPQAFHALETAQVFGKVVIALRPWPGPDATTWAVGLSTD